MCYFASMMVLRLSGDESRCQIVPQIGLVKHAATWSKHAIPALQRGMSGHALPRNRQQKKR